MSWRKSALSPPPQPAGTAMLHSNLNPARGHGDGGAETRTISRSVSHALMLHHMRQALYGGEAQQCRLSGTYRIRLSIILAFAMMLSLYPQAK